MGDIGLHGDTLYPSINPFRPLGLLSLKVTSVWLWLQTSPVHFIAELYIWTPLVSLASHSSTRPPRTVHAVFSAYPTRLTLSTAAATDSDFHKLSDRICPYCPVEEPHGHRFHLIPIMYFIKHRTNQISIMAAPHVWGCRGKKLFTGTQLH